MLCQFSNLANLCMWWLKDCQTASQMNALGILCGVLVCECICTSKYERFFHYNSKICIYRLGKNRLILIRGQQIKISFQNSYSKFYSTRFTPWCDSSSCHQNVSTIAKCSMQCKALLSVNVNGNFLVFGVPTTCNRWIHTSVINFTW